MGTKPGRPQRAYRNPDFRTLTRERPQPADSVPPQPKSRSVVRRPRDTYNHHRQQQQDEKENCGATIVKPRPPDGMGEPSAYTLRKRPSHRNLVLTQNPTMLNKYPLSDSTTTPATPKFEGKQTVQPPVQQPRKTYGQLAVQTRCKNVFFAFTRSDTSGFSSTAIVTLTDPEPLKRRQNTESLVPVHVVPQSRPYVGTVPTSSKNLVSEIRKSGNTRSEIIPLRKKQSCKAVIWTGGSSAKKENVLPPMTAANTVRSRAEETRPQKADTNSAKHASKEPDSRTRGIEVDIMKEMHKRRIKKRLAKTRDPEARSLAEKRRVWVGENGKFSKARLRDWYIRMHS